MSIPRNLSESWSQTLKVASAFWAVCLLLVGVEASYGANAFGAIVFMISVPVLVGFLIWAHRDLLAYLRSGLLGAFALGCYFLIEASVIVFVGLFAGAHLKQLIAPA